MLQPGEFCYLAINNSLTVIFRIEFYQEFDRSHCHCIPSFLYCIPPYPCILSQHINCVLHLVLILNLNKLKNLLYHTDPLFYHNRIHGSFKHWWVPLYESLRSRFQPQCYRVWLLLGLWRLYSNLWSYLLTHRTYSVLTETLASMPQTTHFDGV